MAAARGGPRGPQKKKQRRVTRDVTDSRCAKQQCNEDRHWVVDDKKNGRSGPTAGKSGLTVGKEEHSQLQARICKDDSLQKSDRKGPRSGRVAAK